MVQSLILQKIEKGAKCNIWLLLIFEQSFSHNMKHPRKLFFCFDRVFHPYPKIRYQTCGVVQGTSEVNSKCMSRKILSNV